jgi:hypothetical protein
MRLLGAPLPLGLLAFALALPAVPVHAESATAVSVEASAVWDGPCSGTVTFTGRISLDGKGAATYKWIRSDGDTMEFPPLVFLAGGTQIVTTTWAFTSPPNFGMKLHVLKPNDRVSPEARFTNSCPLIQPDLALSLDIDNPAVWPKKILLTNLGAPSKPTFLAVSYQTLSATDANVKNYCALLDEQKTQTIVEMKKGASRSFDVPALPPSLARKQALAPPPPTPTPGKGLKAALQPTMTYHDANTHQVVNCQYRIDAKLGTDTNTNDADMKNNTLSRTIRIDAPMD